MFGIFNIELNNRDQKFGVKYVPPQLNLFVNTEIPFEEFEGIFKERMESLHMVGSEIILLREEINPKDALEPLSIFVKSQTREFFRNNSMLSASEVLEAYETFSNDPEAFVISLLNEKRYLEQELSKMKEKVQKVKSYKDELNNSDLENEFEDDENVSQLNNEYDDSRVKVEVL